MRWFKHMTDFRETDLAVHMYDLDGLGGYGFLAILFEIVAKDWDGRGVPVITRSKKAWARAIGCHSNKVAKYMNVIERYGQRNTDVSTENQTGNGHEADRYGEGNAEVTVEFVEGGYRVSVPKLLQLKDEYTRKSGHTPDNVALQPQPDPEEKPEIEEDQPPRPRKEDSTQEDGGNGVVDFTCSTDGLKSVDTGTVAALNESCSRVIQESKKERLSDSHFRLLMTKAIAVQLESGCSRAVNRVEKVMQMYRYNAVKRAAIGLLLDGTPRLERLKFIEHRAKQASIDIDEEEQRKRASAAQLRGPTDPRTLDFGDVIKKLESESQCRR